MARARPGPTDWSDKTTGLAEAIAEAAPDALLCVDERGRIVFVNRQAEILFGYTRAALVGQAVENLIPRRAAPAHAGHRAKYAQEPKARPMGVGLQLTALRADGTEIPVDISLASIDTTQGTIVLAAVRDISERLQIESERALLQTELVHAQQEEEKAVLTAQLHQAQRLESVGRLAGGVAHDFNNLLAAIVNYTELVGEDLAIIGDRHGLATDAGLLAVADDVKEIFNIAQRAAHLARQLLIFSRRDVIQPEVLELNAVVHDMEKLLRRTIGESIALRTKLAEDLPAINADRGQLEQVIVNLAVNARDAMPEGGLLTVETSRFVADEEYVRRRPVEPGTFCRLSVSDTGAGMGPDVIARAFEPFFTTKPEGEGSGLGLATTYGIVTQAGGDVMIYSEPGLGTTIRILFPATSGIETAGKGAVVTPLRGGQGQTILLVEDEGIVREPTRRLLESHGYVVISAGSPDEALALSSAHGEEIELLLTDVIMPGRSGRELAALVRDTRPDISVLYMSGYSRDIVTHRELAGTSDRLIEKPFEAATLLEEIWSALTTHPRGHGRTEPA